MMRFRLLLLALATPLAPFLLTACGGGQNVDNDTCPANDANSYYSEPGTNGDAVGQQIAQMPHTHVQPPVKITYAHNPPTSGCHYNLGAQKAGDPMAPLAPGVYTAHIDAEYWVHNLEHGYIVVVYNCPQGCAADFQALRTWYQQQGADTVGYAKVIVIPWSFDHKFAALSWDWYDPMDSLNLGELQRFHDSHFGQGPEPGGG